MRKFIGATAAAVLIATLALSTAPAGAVPETPEDAASVTLVHAAPFGPNGSTVTVCLNGEPLLGTFVVGDTVTLETIAGTYNAAIYVGAEQPCSGEPALAATLTLAAGDNLSVIAHFTAEGALKLTTLANPVECTPPGQGRLVGRHMAAAGPVDAIINGDLVDFNLANGAQVAENLPAATYAISIVSAADPSGVVVPTTDVTIKDGVVTIITVYGNNGLVPTQPLPVLVPVGVIVQEIDVESCEVPAPTPEQPAEPTVAKPAFTG
jgi:hypothetical protein